MRRLLFEGSALAVVLVLPHAVHGQSIGFKLGGSLANQEFDPEAESSSIGAFAGGGFVRFGLGRLGVQVEALSITRGSEDEATNSETKIEYIEVPLLLHLPLTLGQSFAPYVIGGPSIAFDVDCELETTSGVTAECPDREKTDFGLSAGGGLGVAAGPGALLFEGRYTWGLKNISKAEAVAVKNRTALFVVGYELPIGRR
jgi:hypothetical protein